MDRCKRDTYPAMFTSEGVTGVINVQVSVKGRGVIEYTSHGQCGSNVSRAHDHVTLASTSALGNRVGVSFDLEDKSLELLNRPATVGVNVEVKEHRQVATYGEQHLAQQSR